MVGSLKRKSARLLSLEKLAGERGDTLYKVWGGYELSDNKINGFRKEFQRLDDVADF